MNFEYPIISAVFSALIMGATALKWKLPRRVAMISIGCIVLLTALPFIGIYPLANTVLVFGVVAASQILASIVLGLTLVLIRFWRDPERIPPEEDGVVLSAADGQIAYIWNITEAAEILVSKGNRNYRLNELTNTAFPVNCVHIIGIGMSFLDVHVNRCPISGKIRLTKHIPGKFLSLGKDEAPFVNERLTTVIENSSINIAIVQIASRLVRRIQSYLEPGDTVSAGQRLGMIRLGSLVAVIIPDREDIRIDVKPGDNVKAGLSVLAHYRVDSRVKN